MIRFVDLTNAYWTFPEDPECSKPICAFLDTITDRFVLNACGNHTCSDMEDVLSLGMTEPGDLGQRCAGLVPSGFFDKANDLQAECHNDCAFVVGDVVKARGGSFGIVVGRRGNLVRVIFDDGVRLGITPNKQEEAIIQHVTPCRTVIVPPELDCHNLELRRKLVHSILTNNGSKSHES